MLILLGYHVFETREIVLDPKRIVLRYLKTYFIFDFLGALSVNMIIMDILGIQQPYLLYFCACARLCRFARLKTMLTYFKQLTTMWNISEEACVVLCLVLMTFYMVHWWACIVFLVPKLRYKFFMNLPTNSWIRQAKVLPTQDASQMSQYLNALVMASCHFYLAGTGMYKILDPYEQIIFTLVLTSGLVYFAYVAAVIFHLLSSTNVSKNKFEDIMMQLREYSRKKHLPAYISNRMIMYFENKFQQHYFREQAILMTLSEQLRNELAVYCTKRLVSKVSVFNGLSQLITSDLAAHLKQDMFLPNDILYFAGSIAEAMYFIVHGTVAFLLPDGKEMCHFQDGDHFGEASLIVKASHKIRSVTCVAIEFTECLRLDEDDLRHLMTIHDDFAHRMNIVARTNHRKLNELIKQANTYASGVVGHDLLYDLRHDKLLQHRPARRQLVKK